MNRRTTPAPPMLCTYPKFGCAKPAPSGYSSCSRQCGHDGPCAMDFEPTIIGEAESLFIHVKGASQSVGTPENPIYPDFMILPWRKYWGWILGGYPRSGSFASTRVYLNPFRRMPRIHWTVEQ